MSNRIRTALLAFVAAGLAAACQSSPPAGASGSPSASPAAQEESASLKEGDMAPDVDLTFQSGTTVKLSSLRGKTVAIYFYPKDDTPGCRVEAQGLRDSWPDLGAANVTVIGVSTQGADSHKQFIEKEKLPFDLAVDEGGAIAKAFRVPLSGGLAARQTFLIGPDGRIKKVWLKVKPDGHAAEILAAAKS